MQGRSTGSHDDRLYGRNPVLEAARAGRVRRVYLIAGHTYDQDPRLDEIRTLVPAAHVAEIPSQQFDRLAPGAVHQGVIAETRPRQFAGLKEVLGTAPTLLVGLDSILDPQNLGAILRSAEAAGADAVIVPEHRSAPISAAAAKASAGATEHLKLVRVAGLASAIADIKRAQIWTVVLDTDGELLPWEFDFTQPVCIVVGGEGAGVHRLVKERANARVRLPMAGRVASLNVSAAAAVVLYEAAAQRLGR